MNYRLIFILNAVVLALFGVGLLIMPQFMLDQFKTETYIGMILMARFFGGTLLLTAVLYWFGKDAEGNEKPLAFVSLAGTVVGFILTLLGIEGSGAVIRHNGWILLVVFGVFILLYVYLLFLQPPAEKKQRAPRKPKAQQPAQ
jgi:peptidoglycan/LPS O-acetylase OafA/YrhL